MTDKQGWSNRGRAGDIRPVPSWDAIKPKKPSNEVMAHINYLLTHEGWTKKEREEGRVMTFHFPTDDAEDSEAAIKEEYAKAGWKVTTDAAFSVNGRTETELMLRFVAVPYSESTETKADR